MKDKLEWWCYLHTNGSVQAKRYFDPRDLEDADESPFVKVRTNPFMASGRSDAIKKFRDHLVARHVFKELTRNI